MNKILEFWEAQKKVEKMIADIKVPSEFLAAIEAQQKLQEHSKAHKWAADISSKASEQMKRMMGIDAFVNRKIQSKLWNFDLDKADFASTRAFLDMAALSESKPLLAKTLTSFAYSQMDLSRTLESMASKVDLPKWNLFSGLDYALTGINNEFVRHNARVDNTEEIAIAEEANHSITKAAKEIIESTGPVTAAQLEQFKTELITEFSALVRKTKTDKARQLIAEIITLISFVLIFYNPFVPKDNSNSKATIELREEMQNFKKELGQQIEKSINKVSKSRVARIATELKLKPQRKSKTLAWIKPGQEVNVIDSINKFILVVFTDMGTREQRSGFVLKKYFIAGL